MSERDDLQAEVEATREHLAATVDALGDKFDVKARAKENQRTLAIAGAVAAAALIAVVVLKRR